MAKWQRLGKRKWWVHRAQASCLACNKWHTKLKKKPAASTLSWNFSIIDVTSVRPSVYLAAFSLPLSLSPSLIATVFKAARGEKVIWCYDKYEEFTCTPVSLNASGHLHLGTSTATATRWWRRIWGGIMVSRIKPTALRRRYWYTSLTLSRLILKWFAISCRWVSRGHQLLAEGEARGRTMIWV